MGTNKSSLTKTSLSQKTNPNDKVISDSNEKDYNKLGSFTNEKD